MMIVVAAGFTNADMEALHSDLQRAGFRPADDAWARWLDALVPEGKCAAQAGTSLDPDEEFAEQAKALLSRTNEGGLLFTDSRVLAVLDFLAACSPDARFVLFYVKAARALAQALCFGADPQQFLADWRDAGRTLVQFQRRHRDRAHLFEAEAAVRHPQAAEDAFRRVGLRLAVSEGRGTLAIPAIEQLMAAYLVSDAPAVQESEEVLEASAEPIEISGRDDLFEIWDVLNRLHLYPTYQQELRRELDELYARKLTLTQERRTEELWRECKRTQHEDARRRSLEREVAVAEEALRVAEQRLQEQQLQLEELHAELERVRDEKRALEIGSADSTQENELLLLQLHQVEEELAHYISACNELARSEPVAPAKAPANVATQCTTAEEGTWLKRAGARLRPSSVLLGRRRKERKKLQRLIALIKSSGVFDEGWYLAAYPDVASAHLDPVEHYIRFGSTEGRNPSAHFDTAFYLAANPDVAHARVNPLVHFIKFGQKEGRQPSNRVHAA